MGERALIWHVHQEGLQSLVVHHEGPQGIQGSQRHRQDAPLFQWPKANLSLLTEWVTGVSDNSLHILQRVCLSLSGILNFPSGMLLRLLLTVHLLSKSSWEVQHSHTLPKEMRCWGNIKFSSVPEGTRLWGWESLAFPVILQAPGLLEATRSLKMWHPQLQSTQMLLVTFCGSVTNWSLHCFLGRNTYLCCLPQIYTFLKDNSKRPSVKNKVCFSLLLLPSILIPAKAKGLFPLKRFPWN